MNREEKIAELVGIVRAGKAVLDDARAEVGPAMKAAKDELAGLLAEHGNWKDEDGYAQLSAEGERISYDAARLGELLLRTAAVLNTLEERAALLRKTVQQPEAVLAYNDLQELRALWLEITNARRVTTIKPSVRVK